MPMIPYEGEVNDFTRKVSPASKKLEEQLRSKDPAGVIEEPAASSSPTYLGEAVKGGVRGITNLVEAIGKQGAKAMPQELPLGMGPVPTDPQAGALWQQLQQGVKPDPNATMGQQMLGTGAEIAAGSAPFLGGVPGAVQKTLGAVVPGIGGAVGEQLEGETGKLIGSVVAPFGQSAISRVLKPRGLPGQAGTDLRELQEAGVHPSLGQTLGGWAKKFEGLPIVRDFAASSQRRANEQWNTAALTDALKPINGKVSRPGFDGLADADAQVSLAYDRAIQGAGPMTWTPEFSRDLKAALRKVPTAAARREVREIFISANRLNPGDISLWPRTKTSYGSAPQLKPEDFKVVDSALGEQSRNFAGGDGQGKMISKGIYELQSVYRKHFGLQNPANAPEMEKANAAYKNLVRVQQAQVDSAKNLGIFDPGGLMAAVKSHDVTGGKGLVQQKAPMEDFAMKGIRVLGDPTREHIPYSLLAGATGASFINPYTLPVALAGTGLMGLYNPGTQAMLPTLLSKRPQWMQQAGQAMQPNAASRLAPFPGAVSNGLFDRLGFE